jgi:putative heme iron utilization protein
MGSEACSPRGLLDKLGVKPGMKVSLLGIDDENFKKQLEARTGLVEVKVASFSETLSALKMVIPVKDRPVLR